MTASPAILLGHAQSKMISISLACDILSQQRSSRQHIEWRLRDRECIDVPVKNEACVIWIVIGIALGNIQCRQASESGKCATSNRRDQIVAQIPVGAVCESSHRDVRVQSFIQ